MAEQFGRVTDKNSYDLIGSEKEIAILFNLRIQC